MPILPDLKWERFAAAVAKGTPQAEAYKSAGFNTKFPDSAASKLARKPEVAARIRTLKSRVTDLGVSKAGAKLAIDKEWVLRELIDNAELAKIAGAWGPRNRSIELIGKELGMFGDIQPPPPPKTLEDLPSEILEQILRESSEPEPEAPQPIQ